MIWFLVLLACGGPSDEKVVLGVEERTAVKPVAPLIEATSSPQLVGPADALRPGMDAAAARAVFDELRHPAAEPLDKELGGYRVLSAPIYGWDRLGITLFIQEGRLAKVDQSFAPEMEEVLVDTWGPGDDADGGRVWSGAEGEIARLTHVETPLPRVVVTFEAR